VQKIKGKFLNYFCFVFAFTLLFQPLTIGFCVDNSTVSLTTRLEEKGIWHRIKKDVKKLWESLFSQEEDYRVEIPIPPPPPPPIGPVKGTASENSTLWQWYK